MKTQASLCAIAASALISSAYAAETTTFVYDELGRLAQSSNSGGPRSGKTAATGYDPGGNRQAVAVGQPLPPPTNAGVFSISGTAALDEGGSATYTITKVGTTQSDLTINYATVNGSAAAPGDFTAISGTLTFKRWETIRTVSVAVLSDGIGEGAEQFSVALSSPSPGGSISTGSATTTINASGSPNQPPTPVLDALGSVGVCMSASKDLIANDTDPDGNYPLYLVGVGTTPMGEATVESSTTIGFLAYGATGNGTVSYTVSDSLGATATGTLSFSIVNGPGCN